MMLYVGAVTTSGAWNDTSPCCFLEVAQHLGNDFEVAFVDHA